MNTKVLSNLNYGLYVVTVNDGVKDNGCIINTVMQVTSDPLQIAIAVNKKNYTNSVIQKTQKFNISIISEDAKFDLFERFGFCSGHNTDKFMNFNAIKRSPNGLLFITENTNSFMSLYVKNEIDLGTHSLFIAQVTASELLSDIPTASYAYYQNQIKPKPTQQEGKWVCKVCGYVYDGETLPEGFICPLCKHGIEDFEKI